ncbi:unnamed protein product [Candidula unifasciata]|uniref:Tudor domain-containing protein n=1 Tax=Candidula unifasciata TaxID=100452 RepID=A0A8S3YX26_9EUPU|nr:unnamed protein product [Candidula unifasciata]
MSSLSSAKKGNRKATDLETSTVSSVPSPVTSCGPVPGSSSAASTSMASPATPRVLPPRFPLRVGITWQKGEKLEAMDFSRTWYPSKIVDIDEEAKYVLIHFEGWNQRYDEWVPMDSDKLRPVTRHSDRKDKGVKKRRIHPHPVSDLPYIYRAGDKVLAKWTDCKKYPAKISRLMEDGMYEVIFYDGVTRHIQPINIQPIPEEMSHLVSKTVPIEVPPAPKAKLSFKQIKVSLPVLDRIRLSSRGRIIRRKKFQPKKSTSCSGRGRPVGSLDSVEDVVSCNHYYFSFCFVQTQLFILTVCCNYFHHLL